MRANSLRRPRRSDLRVASWRAPVGLAFFIASPDILRSDQDVGEALTMLTILPGPDIAPHHDRPIAILDRSDWAA